MKNIVLMIGICSWLNLVLAQNIIGQYCYFDSVNDKKYQYNQSGKIDLISTNGLWMPLLDSATFYNHLSYDNDSLLTTVTEYVVNYSGDTVLSPRITTTYEYNNGLLSRIRNSSVIIDDFIWESSKIVEFKYYYFDFAIDSIIDSSLTRIIQFTYLNNNIHHSLYKEISSGYIYSNCYYDYDNKNNPYYESEAALVNLSLFYYSSLNNWISDSDGASRDIICNAQNYPVYIVTHAINGNILYDTITYDCTNSTLEQPPIDEYKLEFIPNPATDFFIIRSNINLKIKEVKIFDLNGSVLVYEYDSEKINVKSLKPGIYLVECRFGEIILRAKILIYTS
jgi:hypothetical protein